MRIIDEFRNEFSNVDRDEHRTTLTSNDGTAQLILTTLNGQRIGVTRTRLIAGDCETPDEFEIVEHRTVDTRRYGWSKVTEMCNRFARNKIAEDEAEATIDKITDNKEGK